ncbi:TetR/AcrR family transcriptional regulator [Mycolicibacterium sp. 050232]|uniref:TetR/AcrR family transcriptional regulator n=1 Tax=Mycolicibacterium sp. 050232 TaxID=3113982 RepID=UPI002E29F243|nr:TetR/AcrR family transcriptional regulator [Mycolicibacterium sp. 050232]MED5811290.1 TetR/AcrR family transcriptional regulator [Mycolicibacterium sp. 050232]
MARDEGQTERPMTRRRVETRQRLLEAAFSVFAAKGFGRTRIDDICQASGYTKGAFYSNFGTLDELFLALYREQSREFAEHTVRFLAAEPFDTVEATIEAWAQDLPIDRDWLLINTDFVLYAARRPEVQLELAAERSQMREDFAHMLAGHIGDRVPQLPASLPTPADMARALVTVYDGAISQLILDMDEQSVRQHFADIASALFR